MKKIVLSSFISLVLASGAFAGECDNVPNYDRKEGHKTVALKDAFKSNISKNIRVCVDYDVKSLWKIAMKEAIDDLNSELSSLDTVLKFSYTENNCIINTEMSYNITQLARAEYSRLNPGEIKILINANIDTISGLKKMKYILAHELLHSVGFMHTGLKYSNPNIYEIPHTDGYWATKFASRSIMCSVVPNEKHPLIKFNNLDKVAIETLYPK